MELSERLRLSVSESLRVRVAAGFHILVERARVACGRTRALSLRVQSLSIILPSPINLHKMNVLTFTERLYLRAALLNNHISIQSSPH
jgi:hypothetical protein